MTIDRHDLTALMGIICLGAALWFAVGWPGVLGYTGALLIITGIVGARGRKRSA